MGETGQPPTTLRKQDKPQASTCTQEVVQEIPKQYIQTKLNKRNYRKITESSTGETEGIIKSASNTKKQPIIHHGHDKRQRITDHMGYATGYDLENATKKVEGWKLQLSGLTADQKISQVTITSPVETKSPSV